MEGVAFFQQALFQFHGHVDAVAAQPFIQMVRKELRKLDGRHKSLGEHGTLTLGVGRKELIHPFRKDDGFP